MLNVSPTFMQKADDFQREVKALLEVVFTEDDVLKQVSAQASSYLDETTEPNQICNGRIRKTEYDAVGEVPLEFAQRQNGWYSSGASDANGLILENVTLSYPGSITVKTLWFVSEKGYYPVDFTVELFHNNAWTEIVTVTDNDKPVWSFNLTDAKQANKIRLSISRISTANNNVRIMEFGVPFRLMLEDFDIESFNILEEASSDTEIPLGSVTSNELSLSLRNDHKWFTPSNTKSPFSKLLKPGIIFKPYLGVKVAKEKYEFVPMGRFNTYDWAPPDVAINISVTAYDRLYQMAQEPIPKIPVMRDVTIAHLLRTVFAAYGLNSSEYIIDSKLNQPIKMAWLPKGSLFSGLKTISAAGNCSITTDRNNRIIASSNFNAPEPVADIAGDKHISSLTNPHSYLATYSGVKVVYKIPRQGSKTQVLKLEGLEVTPGVSNITDISFSSGPVIRVEKYRVLQDEDVRVTKLSNGAWTCDIEVINNTSETKTIDVEIHGTTVELVDAEFNVSDRSTIDLIGERPYEIDNPLIQSNTVAKTYGRSMLSYVIEPGSTYRGEIRGNPAIELFDVLKATNKADNMENVLICPTRFSFNYDGGLSVSMQGRKPIIPKRPVFLSKYQVIMAPVRPDRISY